MYIVLDWEHLGWFGKRDVNGRFPLEIGASKIKLGLRFWDPPVATRQGPASYKTLVSSSETLTNADWILT